MSVSSSSSMAWLIRSSSGLRPEPICAGRAGARAVALLVLAALGPSEVALLLLLLHGAGGVVVDDASLPLGAGGEQHLLDDLGERRRVALDGAGERVAAERPEADVLDHRLLARLERHAVVVDHDQR